MDELVANWDRSTDDGSARWQSGSRSLDEM